jgi:hypothetical protein
LIIIHVRDLIGNLNGRWWLYTCLHGSVVCLIVAVPVDVSVILRYHLVKQRRELLLKLEEYLGRG